MAEEKTNLEIDDWLADLAEETPAAPGEAPPAELNQPDIDALLGTEAAPVGTHPDSEDRELDQSDIDALLGGDAGGEGEDFAELNQSDIDSLLGGGEAPAPGSAEEEDFPAEEVFDLGQADIDDLFVDPGGEDGSGAPVMADGPAASGQDDIERLFSDIQGQEPARPETTRFAATAREGGGKAEAAGLGEASFGLPADGGFEEDAFDFGDLPDIPDETDVVGTAPQGGLGKEDLFAATPAIETPDIPDGAATDSSRECPPAGNDPPFVLSSEAGKNKVLTLAGLCLLVLLLLGGGGIWYILTNKKAEKPVPVAPPVQETPVAPPNAGPVASESRWRLAQPDEPLPIELAGTDENNDPLTFEIVTLPKFGSLSCDLPRVTYLAGKDFPGEDSFEFRVSDGKLASCPAKVVVAGLEKIPPVAAAAAKDVPAEHPVVAANNVRLRTLSTAPLVIDWKKIWAGANVKPFDARVSVEILGGQPLRGVLHRLDSTRHRYEPDRYFGGTEVVRYRFKVDGIFSQAREIAITVTANDKPPLLVLNPLADSYTVGERVLLDAGKSRDDSPGGLQYTWEQLAGPRVSLEKHRGEGSAVSFVVPASFRAEQKTGILLRVTATDAGGQRTSKEIAITPVSKRQSALWGVGE